MIPILIRLPLDLTRRAAHMTVLVAGEVGGTLFPTLRMPSDRIAWEAWTTWQH